MFDESTVNAGQEGNVDLQIEEVTEVEEVTAEEAPEQEESSIDVESVEGDVATPKQSKETNSEFAKVRKEAEARAREIATKEANQRIASLYAEYGIGSIDELEQAITQQKRQAEVDSLSERGYTQDEIDEIIEAREIKRQHAQVQEREKSQEQIRQMVSEFKSIFPNVDIGTIPQEVLDQVASGSDLTKAYAIHQINNIGNIKAQAQQDAIKALKNNAETSTGSLSGTSQEQQSMSIADVNKMLESMGSQQRSKWIDANYSNLEKWGYFKNF